MRLFSILFALILSSGAIRFYGISLIDEVILLLLVVLLLFFKKRSVKSQHEIDVGQDFISANWTFGVLCTYLIFSLLHGVIYDAYFGKFRWLIIFISLVILGPALSFYFKRRLLYFDYRRFVAPVYHFLLVFSCFYLSYGVIASAVFNVEPAYIQSAEVSAWYAIWGTSAYTSIIFLPLLLFNRALYSNHHISRSKFLMVYVLTACTALFYDSRVMAVMLAGFWFAEFMLLKARFKTLTLGAVVLLASLFGAQLSLIDWSSSGGFLFSLLDENIETTTVGDFDRVAHYIAAYDVVTSSLRNALIGVGFLNAGTAIIPAYIAVYSEYGVVVGAMSRNLSGVSMGTFGLSAFVIENGLVGIILLLAHVYNLCKLVVRSSLIVSPIFIFVSYAALLLIFFSIYINDNMAFYLLLSPMFLFPLISRRTHR